MNYFLLNTVSKRRTKMARKAAPAPKKYAQRFLGGKVRLTRGRHYKLSEEQLKQYWDDLKKKWVEGVCEIRLGTPRGPIFQFDTLKDGPKEPEAEVVEEEVEEAPEAPPEVEEPAEETEVEVNVEELDVEEEEVLDFKSMTNKELIAYIIDNSDWEEKDLRKMKKAELLELIS